MDNLSERSEWVQVRSDVASLFDELDKFPSYSFFVANNGNGSKEVTDRKYFEKRQGYSLGHFGKGQISKRNKIIAIS